MKRAALYGLSVGLVTWLAAEVAVAYIAYTRFHSAPWRRSKWGQT